MQNPLPHSTSPKHIFQTKKQKKIHIYNILIINLIETSEKHDI